jgi:sugar/nucleoside kinase (ribokinase family)
MTDKRYDVVGIGVAAVDDLLYVPAYPPADVKVPITRSARHAGGLTCTAMAAVGALGGRCAYVARLGDDELSTYIKHALSQRNVDVSAVIPDANAQPFHSTIIIDNAGARTVFYDCSRFHPPLQLADDLLESTRVLFLDYLIDPPMIGIAQQAKARNIQIVADIEGRSDSCRPLLPLIDHLIVSGEFALWAANTNDPRAACAILAESPRTATIVTLGEHGCFLATQPSATPQHIPAFRVNATDTNGCGDTFHGAYALASARGLFPHDAAVFATAAAALKASGKGGWSSLPSGADMQAFLSQQVSAIPPAVAQCLRNLSKS